MDAFARMAAAVHNRVRAWPRPWPSAARARHDGDAVAPGVIDAHERD
ncbi:MAG: hypothetical protein HY056_17935 [Proteobacteria bacterium]|nr:hypothetical protein [Pseudomonadota bacterium]